VVAVAVVVVVV
jgi:hypothetical protein